MSFLTGFPVGADCFAIFLGKITRMVPVGRTSVWMGSCLPFPFHLPEGCPFEDLKKHAGIRV